MHRSIPSDESWMKLLSLDSERALVWYLLDTRFREVHGSCMAKIDWERFNWSRALSYADHNLVLYEFCREILKGWTTHLNGDALDLSRSVVKWGRHELQRMLKTLRTIKNLWDDRVDYYVVKTDADAAAYDVDVLFKNKADYELAISLAQSTGFGFVREEPFKGWIGVDEGVKIELHDGISWFGMKALDDEFTMAIPKKMKLMGLAFETIGEEAEFALALAHWIMDLQPLNLVGFSDLISKFEREHRWEVILDQAEKYGWAEQLTYHLSVLKKLCEHVYGHRLRLPVNPLPVKIRPGFPFWTPTRRKTWFLVKKVLHDNNGLASRLAMLQLSLRRYFWGRIREKWT